MKWRWMQLQLDPDLGEIVHGQLCITWRRARWPFRTLYSIWSVSVVNDSIHPVSGAKRTARETKSMRKVTREAQTELRNM